MTDKTLEQLEQEATAAKAALEAAKIAVAAKHIQLIRQGDRRVHPQQVTVRHLTPAEVMATPLRKRQAIILNNGRLGEVTVTSIRLWKTRPNEMLIGVKYGMYEYTKLTFEEACAKFVEEVEQS